MNVSAIYAELRDVCSADYRKTILRRITTDAERRELLRLAGHDVFESIGEETVLNMLETLMLTPTFFFQVYETRIAELEAKCRAS